MPTTEDFIAAAWTAAPHFDLAPESISLLSHSENVVCEVGLGDGQRVAMRLHRVGYNTLAELQSEVAWVDSLRTSGVPVPTARQTVEGGHYLPVEVGGQTCQVGVIEWVQGEPLGGPTQSQGAEVIDHYVSIGRVAAQIRDHHAQWNSPIGFVRRTWDLDGFLGAAPLWGRFWEVEGLTQSQQQLFSTCRDALRIELSQLRKDDNSYGLVHADLHLGNLMADGDQLTVIDFDDAGYSWFVYELAVALHPVLDEPWEADARAALLKGYRSVHPLSTDDERLIDSFLTVRCLMIVGWLSARRELPIFEFFGDLVAQAETAATRYLASHS